MLDIDGISDNVIVFGPLQKAEEITEHKLSDTSSVLQICHYVATAPNTSSSTTTTTTTTTTTCTTYF